MTPATALCTFKNRETLSELYEEVKELNAILMDDYHNFCEDYENDIFDRTNFQLKSLTEIKSKELETLNMIKEKHILNKRETLQKATEGKINKVLQKYDNTEKDILSKREINNKLKDVAIIVLLIEK